ncbi:dmX-like protein 2 isoform X2 [Nematostella vectensis]|uniref:dmX-like protein 2 isoform X2 n=1 Tax=Nematostella vectensis TaxID=45351 RepID=UPI00207789F6|nr:dmX-like protein 2 isoform X2 [Nematostella vectensis]
MKLHQVLTGAANTFDDKAAIAVGSVEDNPFTAYASGCDIVILLSGFTRVQIIPGSLYGYKEVCCVDCCDTDGKIAAAYGPKVVTFGARPTPPDSDNGFPYHWEQCSELCLKFKITCLSWNREGTQLLIGGDYLQLWTCQSDIEYPSGSPGEFWSCVWMCRPAVPIYVIQFSSNSQYFASFGKNDRLVKIWFQKSNVEFQESQREMTNDRCLDFSFIYLAHPRAVTGLTWRKTSKYMPLSSVSSVLLTSCIDNICRIWCETMQQDQYYDNPAPPLQKGTKCARHDTRPVHDPLLKHKMTSSLHFHLSTVVNPLSDIPLLSSMGSFAPKGSRSSFMLHWLNNKEIQFTVSAEASLGAPVAALEVQSVEVSDDSSEESDGRGNHSDFDVLEPIDVHGLDQSARRGEMSPTDADKKDTTTDRAKPKEKKTDKRRAKTLPPPRPRTPLEYLKQLQNNKTRNMTVSPYYDSYVSSAIGNMLREWYKSPDTLIAVHPVDGSLLVWLIEWLDVQPGSQYRQPQVSFLSRIPMAIPPADANSLLPKLIVYCPRIDKIRALRHAVSQVGKSKPVSPKALRAHFGSSSSGAQATGIMVSTHRDGALNHWQLVFADDSSFSTVVSISHIARRCGHRYPITTILAHPELPLLLSTSSHVLEGMRTELNTRDEVEGEVLDSKNSLVKIHCSELVVWRVESISPLRQSGGVLELTRVHSSRPRAFENIAWVPTLFSYSLITFENTTLLPPQATAPCACFLAADGLSYRFYQVILDARMLQTFISSHKSRTRSTLYSSGSEESIDSLDLETPTVNVPLDAFIESIVSRQSGSNPGCILKLCSLADSRDVLQRPLLLHVFTEQSIRNASSVSSHNMRGGDHETEDSEETFFVVGVENVPDPSAEGRVTSMLHMWRMKVTAKKGKALDEEELFSFPDVASAGSGTDSASSRSTSPLNLPYTSPVSTSISTTKVCTQRLPLPHGVVVTTATRAADKMSSSAVNPTCPAMYLFTTSCSDGKVRFWSCDSLDEGRDFVWEETAWKREVVNGGMVTSPSGGRGTLGLEAPGQVLSISCAYTGRIATLVKTTSPEGEAEDGLLVCIWENESSGGMEWVCEDTLRLSCATHPDTSQIRLEWIAVENGSYILTVCIKNEIFILGCASRISGTSTRGQTISSGNETWLLLHSVHLASENQWQLLNRALSWARNGVLVVGLGTEMQVYSQWKVITDGTMSPSDILNYAPTVTLQKVTHATLDDASTGLVPLSASGGTRIGLFEEAASIAPVLPQYHPKHLMELMNSGKLKRVRAILHHLVQCVVGKEAVQAEARAEFTHSRPRLSSTSIMKSGSFGKSLSELDTTNTAVDTREDREGVLSIPPVPLHALLAADNDTSETGHHGDAPNADRSQALEDNDYSLLFDTPAMSSSVDDESDVLTMRDKRRSRTLTSYGSPLHGVTANDNPVYFGLAQARQLSYQLTRKQLPGLTSIEQLELLALADTFATTKLDLEESPDAIERGLSFAKREVDGIGAVGGLMGGPGGGGGGYATTGSIGATAGSGGDVVDECGLRFLLALRHHTCLMRSLPLMQRAVLEEKGLSSSYFGWAFHSESEEELLAMVPAMLRGEPTWPELRQYGVGWWIRSQDTLKRLMEKVAKAQFSKNQDPLDCALFYLGMKKKNVVCGLYRTVRDTRMSKFFSNDFTQDRWRKAALKNAYQLLGMQRFEHAAAFFLLAGALWDAVQVCIGRLHDIQLAMVLTRLDADHSEGPHYIRVLREYVLDPKPSDLRLDPFLRSITHWILKDYNQALDVLIFKPRSCPHQKKECNDLAARGDPDIFNFYLYLRKHPLIKRRWFTNPDQERRLKGVRHHVAKLRRQQRITDNSFEDDPLTPMERQLFFKTAHAHLNSGCPALALQVLMELPASSLSESKTGSTSDEAPEVNSLHDKTDDMIATGTLGDFGFESPSTKPHQNGERAISTKFGGTGLDDSSSALDWSQPVSTKLGGTGLEDSSSALDWSQPVSTKLGGAGLEDSSSALDWSQPVSTKLGGTGLEDSSSALDWSQPVSTKLGGAGLEDSSSALDWSQPVSTKLGGAGLEDSSSALDWSQPVSTKLGGTGLEDSSSALDWSQPVSTQLGGAGLENSSSGFDWSQPVSSKLGGISLDLDWGQPMSSQLGGPGLDSDGPNEDSISFGSSPVSHNPYISGERDLPRGGPDEVDALYPLPKPKEVRNLDVIAQQMKFSAILKLLLDELHGLPAACELADEDLRSFFMRWMEMEFDTLHKMADYGAVMDLADSEESSVEQVEETGDEDTDKNYIAHKIEKSAKHIQWLRRNRTLLNILLTYCALHGSSGGHLAAMNMELLLLLHEVERCRFLLSPLYVPSAGPSLPPLVLGAISSSTFLASPIGYLQSLTQDILKYLFKLQTPPSPESPVSMLSVLTSLTGTLSDCIYQSLTGIGQEQNDITQRRKNKGKYPCSTSSPKTTTSNRPTSPPARWPGVKLLLSLLATENKDNSTRLRVLLAEACVAVYLSLLSVAWSTSQPNQMYRLVSNQLKPGLWGLVFGGGIKVPQALSSEATTPTETKPSLPTGTRDRPGKPGDKYFSAMRSKWNYKLLGKSAETSESKTPFVEQYVPPSMTIMEYFVSKPIVQGSSVAPTYDSGDEQEESSDDEEYESADEEGFPTFRRKRANEPTDHLDHASYSWCLMNYAISKLALTNLQNFLPDVGFELTDLPSISPQLHSAMKMLELWTQTFLGRLDMYQGPPPDYISQFPVSCESYPRGGPALLRYKALMDPKNTPFRSNRASAEPVKRLWSSLVSQEAIQNTMMRYVFQQDTPNISSDTEGDHLDGAYGKDVRLLHKDTEVINSFCINKANPNVIALSTLRDVQEIDVSHIVSPGPVPWIEEENDVDSGEASRKSAQSSSLDDSEYAMVYGSQSPSSSQSTGEPRPKQRIMELLKRQTTGVKRMDSHPHLPYYVTGSQDGSVRMWEFGHAQQITAHRTAGTHQRVTRIHFSPYGNKVGISDLSGQLFLWQVSSTGTGSSNPYMTLKCHNKQMNDFVFLNSSSFIASAGQSSDGSNICLWDTLVPQRSSLVHAFTCHESGAPCVAHVQEQQLLISGGRKGNICIFDLRQRQLRHTFLAHDAPVKSIAIDESGEFFISGSEDGDIKVWGLTIHDQLACFPKEHGKSTYFKYGTLGVALIRVPSIGEIYSCGGDGTLKWRRISLRDSIVNGRY